MNLDQAKFHLDSACTLEELLVHLIDCERGMNPEDFAQLDLSDLKKFSDAPEDTTGLLSWAQKTVMVREGNCFKAKSREDI